MFTRAKYVIIDCETGEVVGTGPSGDLAFCDSGPHEALYEHEVLRAPAGMVYVLNGSRLITLTAEEG